MLLFKACFIFVKHNDRRILQEIGSKKEKVKSKKEKGESKKEKVKRRKEKVKSKKKEATLILLTWIFKLETLNF